MGEKKTVSMSLSTLFLIIAIIIILVMGFLVYVLFTEKTKTDSFVDELNQKLTTLEQYKENVEKEKTATEKTNTIDEAVTQTEKVNTAKTYTTTNLKGAYVYKKAFVDNDGFYYGLFLYENGTYEYSYYKYAPTGSIGNYVIEGNKIIFYPFYKTSSSTDIFKTSGNFEMKINDDGSITDSSNVTLSVELPSNITLKKSTDQEDIELYNYINVIKKIAENAPED